MKRKLTALILALIMIASLPSAAAADEMTAVPTVEEILNEYHQKVFEVEMLGDTAASTWSRRSGEEKTLEQETVDALTAAGYEAYNVTAANYDALEAELNTDFADMGLDPNGSYIVVIEAEADVENNTVNAGDNSRVLPGTDLEGPDHPGTLPSTYTYDGVTYSLRHVTVTSASDSDLQKSDFATLDDIGYIPESWQELSDLSLVAAVGTTTYNSIKDIEWLITEINSKGNYVLLEPEALVVHVDTAWTRKYIEVYDEWYESWLPRQFSEYACASGWFSCRIKNLTTGEYAEYTQSRSYCNIYSTYYYDIDTRAFDAAAAQRWGSLARDEVDVKYYIDDGDSVIDSASEELFNHDSPGF